MRQRAIRRGAIGIVMAVVTAALGLVIPAQAQADPPANCSGTKTVEKPIDSRTDIAVQYDPSCVYDGVSYVKIEAIYFTTSETKKRYVSFIVRRYQPNWGNPTVISWQKYMGGLSFNITTDYPNILIESNLHPYFYVHWSWSTSGPWTDSPSPVIRLN